MMQVLSSLSEPRGHVLSYDASVVASATARATPRANAPDDFASLLLAIEIIKEQEREPEKEDSRKRNRGDDESDYDNDHVSKRHRGGDAQLVLWPPYEPYGSPEAESCSEEETDATMSDEEGEDGFEWSGRNEETEDEDNCYDVSVGQRAIVTYRDGEECFDEAPLDGEETEDEGHDEDARHMPRNGSLEWLEEDVPSDVEVLKEDIANIPRDGCTNDVKYFEDASSDEEDTEDEGRDHMSREDSTNDDEYSEEVVSFEENPRAEEDDSWLEVFSDSDDSSNDEETYVPKKKEKKREPWLWKVACQDRIETILNESCSIDEVGDENFARALDIDMDRYLGFPVPQYGENSWLPRLADMPAFALVDPDEHPMEWRGTPARSAEGN
ncbi:hypothetical protein IEO21_06692 [Rhodonia placenta]|uniref:Uncharacterized protein n=1 Tax=Rhodonia placenta TaxID=104341 RepID=A0A8H7NZH5_9APHY|nr:hypothetical protein IEO21_06692 [Postia placenta]